jgi:hypothetical protein
LINDRCVDARVGVAEEIDPPRAHGVEKSATFKVVQPTAARRGDRNDRETFVMLHLGARMPHSGEAAL